MNSNEQLIHRFYSAFQQLDHSSMNACYSDYPVFNDAVFGILEGDAVRCMWEMLCKNARDFSLAYGDIRLLDDEYATCKWTARYTFSKTGRKVVNNIKAHMRIQDGKITEHTDEFDIWKWSRQALGLPAILLGWSGYMKMKIRRNALKNLQRFMEQRQQ
jgi:ketosteroid isomerase-like protein